MRKDQHQELMEFAVKIATASGSIARKYFRTAVNVDTKSKLQFDPVTVADREIEQFLRNKIRKHYPDHGIIGEEQGATAGNSSTWIIDPIDGTRGFISGAPMWGTLLGLLDKGKPVLGLMHQPFIRETFYADRQAAWLRQGNSVRQLHTRNTRTLADAILFCTHPSMFDQLADRTAFARLEAECRYSRFGSDCYGYCLLAAGFADLVVEADLKPYDIIPLIPLIESAGGVVTDWQGKTPLNGGRILAAANRRLHRVALELLNE
jgi:histidinol phosphatase-like enzyme (inositol monophosphatase family)